MSDALLAREEMRAALRARDFRSVFLLMKKYDGASQDRIASPVEGLTQGRVSRIVTGQERVQSLEVVERIADGLRIPGALLGLAPRPWEDATTTPAGGGRAPAGAGGSAATLGAAESGRRPGGAVQDRSQGLVDLSLAVDVDIAADGPALVAYHHELLNGGDVAFTRLNRELWFEKTTGRLDIEPGADRDRHVIIQRIHDTPTMAKFACQLLPALQPGESTTLRYTCRGGKFEDAYYWRECPRRPTRRLTIRVRHRGARRLASCTAVEERADGSEISATDSLSCRYDDGDILLEITRENLAPNQAVELRWDVTGEPAR